MSSVAGQGAAAAVDAVPDLDAGQREHPAGALSPSGEAPTSCAAARSRPDRMPDPAYGAPLDCAGRAAQRVREPGKGEPVLCRHAPRWLTSNVIGRRIEGQLEPLRVCAFEVTRWIILPADS